MDLLQEENFQMHVKQLSQLFTLILAGKGNDNESEDIRDAMDYYWYKLNEQQLLIVNGLAEDLNSIGEGEMTKEVRTKKHISDIMKKLYSNDQWIPLLNFIRRNFKSIQSHIVAYFRARIWYWLGYPEIAYLFIQEARSLRPDIAVHMDAEADILIALKRYDDALIVINIIEKTPDVSAIGYLSIVNKIIEISLIQKHEIPNDQATKAISLVDKSFSMESQGDRLEDSYKSHGFLIKSFCYKHLHNAALELEMLQESLKYKTKYEEADIAYALHVYENSFEEAVLHFKKIADSNELKIAS